MQKLNLIRKLCELLYVTLCLFQQYFHCGPVLSILSRLLCVQSVITRVCDLQKHCWAILCVTFVYSFLLTLYLGCIRCIEVIFHGMKHLSSCAHEYCDYLLFVGIIIYFSYWWCKYCFLSVYLAAKYIFKTNVYWTYACSVANARTSYSIFVYVCVYSCFS